MFPQNQTCLLKDVPSPNDKLNTLTFVIDIFMEKNAKRLSLLPKIHILNVILKCCFAKIFKRELNYFVIKIINASCLGELAQLVASPLSVSKIRVQISVKALPF